eukprot:scaffold6145_cov102-Isochrysis_galbana.AAC.8
MARSHSDSEHKAQQRALRFRPAWGSQDSEVQRPGSWPLVHRLVASSPLPLLIKRWIHGVGARAAASSKALPTCRPLARAANAFPPGRWAWPPASRGTRPTSTFFGAPHPVVPPRACAARAPQRRWTSRNVSPGPHGADARRSASRLPRPPRPWRRQFRPRHLPGYR